MSFLPNSAGPRNYPTNTLITASIIAVVFMLVALMQPSAIYAQATAGNGLNCSSSGAGLCNVGPYTLPTPFPSALPDAFWGDSIMAGVGGATCSTTYKTSVAPVGNCLPDLIAIHDGVRSFGLGVAGTCLELTTNGSLCNLPSTTSGSLIARYQTDLATLAYGQRVYLQIGTNDALDWGENASTQVTAAIFRANLATVVQATIAQIGASNLILGEIPWLGQGFMSQTNLINAQIADVAKQYGIPLALTSVAYQACTMAQGYSASLYVCSGDQVHPNAVGAPYMATAYETSNFANAVSAFAASQHDAATNFVSSYSTTLSAGAAAPV